MKNEENVTRQPTFSAFFNAAFKSKPSKTFSDQNDEETKEKIAKRPFQCEQCPKAFASIYTLKNHGAIHRGEKMFSCPFCAKKFFQKDNLSKHMKSIDMSKCMLL